ncbi:hypothetical protein Tco_0351386 [Tanacetum coccineum]
MENYKNVSQDIRNQLDAEAEAVQIILTGIDNDIYSTVDACPNACEMWKAIERLKQGFYKMMNGSLSKSYEVTKQSVNVQFLLQLQPEWQRSQQAATRNRGKSILNSPPPTYDQEPEMVAEDDALTSSNTSRAHQDNTPRINRGTRYDNQRAVNVAGDRENVGTQVAKDAAYHKEKMLLCKQEEAGFQLNAEQANWRDENYDHTKEQNWRAH